MGGEADAGNAEETGGGTEERARGSGRQRGGKEQHMERREKAESVLRDKQEILRQGFLRQNVTIKKGKFKKQNHVVK